jgi:hypothetical protein
MKHRKCISGPLLDRFDPLKIVLFALDQILIEVYAILMISRSRKGVEGVFPGGARVRKMLTILNAMVRDKRPFRFASIA